MRRFATVARLPWEIATGQDLRQPSCTGRPSRAQTASTAWALTVQRLAVHGNLRALGALNRLYHLTGSAGRLAASGAAGRRGPRPAGRPGAVGAAPPRPAESVGGRPRHLWPPGGRRVALPVGLVEGAAMPAGGSTTPGDRVYPATRAALGLHRPVPAGGVRPAVLLAVRGRHRAAVRLAHHPRFHLDDARLGLSGGCLLLRPRRRPPGGGIPSPAASRRSCCSPACWASRRSCTGTGSSTATWPSGCGPACTSPRRCWSCWSGATNRRETTEAIVGDLVLTGPEVALIVAVGIASCLTAVWLFAVPGGGVGGVAVAVDPADRPGRRRHLRAGLRGPGGAGRSPVEQCPASSCRSR